MIILLALTNSMIKYAISIVQMMDVQTLHRTPREPASLFAYNVGWSRHEY
jgi:hypothetical protein